MTVPGTRIDAMRGGALQLTRSLLVSSFNERPSCLIPGQLRGGSVKQDRPCPASSCNYLHHRRHGYGVPRHDGVVLKLVVESAVVVEARFRDGDVG